MALGSSSAQKHLLGATSEVLNIVGMIQYDEVDLSDIEVLYI